jgi:short-subunit dehydrogenase
MKPAIVVTGASSGIGRELARIAAREHEAMVLVARSEGDLEELAGELGRQGVEACAVHIDLTDPQSGATIERVLAERDLYCDVLVNCAGFGVYGAAAEADRAEQINLLDINIRALADLTLRFLPGMISRRRGGVLNVGSISGYAPGPYMAMYYASKAFVKSFSNALAGETDGTGVTITCLAPGIVRTPFFDRCLVGQTHLFRMVPHSTARATAEAGWRAFRAGKRIVTPRLGDRFIAALCVIVPDTVLLWLISRLQRPRL